MPQNQNRSCPEAILASIPWYPEGLTRAERGAVESHAADCQACRAELAFVRGEDEPALELPDAERVSGRVLERIRAHDDRAELPPSAPARRGFAARARARARRVRRRIVQPVGIAAGLLVAVCSGMLTVGVIWIAREAPSYETAAAAPVSAAPPGVELEIAFRRDAEAGQIATDLRAVGVTLTSGPNELDVYRARLAPGADVEESLVRLSGAGHGVARFAVRSIR